MELSAALARLDTEGYAPLGLMDGESEMDERVRPLRNPAFPL